MRPSPGSGPEADRAPLPGGGGEGKYLSEGQGLKGLAGHVGQITIERDHLLRVVLRPTVRRCRGEKVIGLEVKGFRGLGGDWSHRSRGQGLRCQLSRGQGLRVSVVRLSDGQVSQGQEWRIVTIPEAVFIFDI